jgi:hypothetical protein
MRTSDGRAACRGPDGPADTVLRTPPICDADQAASIHAGAAAAADGAIIPRLETALAHAPAAAYIPPRVACKNATTVESIEAIWRRARSARAGIDTVPPPPQHMVRRFLPSPHFAIGALGLSAVATTGFAIQDVTQVRFDAEAALGACYVARTDPDPRRRG